mgnify:CR=1
MSFSVVGYLFHISIIYLDFTSYIFMSIRSWLFNILPNKWSFFEVV